jgi:nucleoid-associated protein YgaU
MSALPIEQPPSGDHRTTTPRGARRTTPVRQLFPDRAAVLPDGDWTFPGGGQSFSGDENRRELPAQAAAWAGAPVTALPPRPGASRPTAAELSLATAADEAWLATVAHARFAPAAAPGAPAAGPHPVRLTLRGRVVLVVIAALAVAGLVIAGATVAQASSPAAAHAGDSRVFVQPGDTLWSIAHRADPGADPQTVIAGILRANHLPAAMVNVGQRIWVPRG